MSRFQMSPGAEHYPQPDFGPHVLAEFRAGKLVKEGNTMKADTRKGKVQVVRADDSMVHLQWVDRTSGEVVDDTIVFPQDAKFHKMPNPRCYMLKFDAEMDRNLYFWMQEPISESDEILVGDANKALSDPDPDDEEMAGVDSALDPPAPTQLSPTAAAATTAASLASIAGTAQGVQASDLQAILSGLGQIPVRPTVDASMLAGALGNAFAAAMAQGGGGGGGGGRMVASGPSLADLLKPEELMPLLSVPELAGRLGEFMPEEHRNSQSQLMELAHSPQFMQQVETFSRALQTGQIDLSQFGLGADTGFGAADFLEAINTKFGSQNKEEQQ